MPLKAKDLAAKLLENPEFDVSFAFSELTGDNIHDYGLTVRRFKNIDICDIGYSDKSISLGGDEE